ncbi:glycosyltransferase [Mucilaginibacter sp. ZT4R22]|uniref:Glycosyltransferase n=1 Tax=Mucilaginibacter pankratovii TaxID=2772110 RepID=A0ABR7WNU0_9SPHI|nr:glycosyltransferase family 2 protein [Mucilaginibacter pankratovii]MBD1363974.1 glycosyltransferase [Mucilaginibacter pankratovii]
MSPFFSIIIPLYNSAETLSATLDSISAQEFTDLELICIDGASSDATLNMIGAFKITHPALLTNVLSEPDKGIYDAMNKGIALTKGSWLYFMGGDDTFQSGQVLSKIYEAIKGSDADLLYGNVTGAVSHNVYNDNTLAKVLFRGIHHQGIFYKKNVFESVGGYDLRFKIAADYHLTLKAFLNKAFKTQYADISIAYFGEAGLSSQQYDWPFYSYHYKLLATHRAIDTPGNERLKCLNDSIYCCFQLAKQKQRLRFAWENMLFYIFGKNGLPLGTKARNLLRMVYWTLRPKA